MYAIKLAHKNRHTNGKLLEITTQTPQTRLAASLISFVARSCPSSRVLHAAFAPRVSLFFFAAYPAIVTLSARRVVVRQNSPDADSDPAGCRAGWQTDRCPASMVIGNQEKKVQRRNTVEQAKSSPNNQHDKVVGSATARCRRQRTHKGQRDGTQVCGCGRCQSASR